MEKMIETSDFDINQMHCGSNPLLYASFYGRDDVINFLLQHDANINIKDLSGATPLMIAIDRNFPDVVQMLIENGADLSLKDAKGYTGMLLDCMQ